MFAEPCVQMAVAVRFLIVGIAELIGGRYGARTVSMVVHRTAPRRDVTGTHRPKICLVHIAGDNRAFRSIYGSDTRPIRLDRTVLL